LQGIEGGGRCFMAQMALKAVTHGAGQRGAPF
jgi:hypothetical protein